MNQQSAQGLAALGRGPDTMLVHMAPEEVAGLQALALKHGGTLTINPETGLAEAGFLKKILPMVAGFALGPAGFGLMSSAMAGLTVGGLSALSSGSLEKGLMAGLGAYGGSGLGESLMGAGTNALSSAGAGTPVPAGVTQAVPVAAPVAATPSAVSAAKIAPDFYGGTANEVASAYGYTAPAIDAAQSVSTVTPTINTAELAAQAGPSTGDFARFDRAFSPGLGASQTDKLGAGFNAATSSPSAALEFAKANKMPLAALGVAALSGADDKKAPAPQSQGMIRPYTYTRTKVPGAFDRTANDSSSQERQYFNDQYTAREPYKAPGPEYMAAGGPVEAMSNANAIGMNTGYPQSSIRTGVYTAPTQVPVSQNMVTGAQDAAVNPYTGEVQFAEGGTVGGYTYDPKTGLYTKPGGQGATTVAPTGGISDLSGVSGGSSTSYVGAPEKTTPAEFAAQSERNQKINDFLTDLTKLSPTNMVMSGLNTLFGTQAPAPVSDMGTSLAAQNNAQSMQSMQDALAADTAAARGTTTGGISNDASAAADGYGTGDSAGFGGGTDSGSDGWAYGGLTALAQGGMSNLGSYSDGGRLLRGPGDGVSDDIPAMIGQKQQARLADGEFVVPARIVSELGNGSTEAGARQLYAMMDRVQKARKKTVGKDKVATNSRAAKLLPA